MKKIALFILVAVGLAACNNHTKVEVAKAQDNSIIVQKQKAEQPVALPANLPRNATAICHDGSFSTATDNSVCSGNGGVKTVIGRYHSE